MNTVTDNITPIRKNKPAAPAKAPRKRTPAKAKADPVPTDIVSQVKIALNKDHRLAAIIGIFFGAFIPVATFYEAHFDGAITWWQQWMLPLLVIGGLAYSASTVYQWGKLAVGSGFKALGFTVLLEGVMTFSNIAWLSYASLAYLMVINGIAMGTKLALPALVAKSKTEIEL